MSTGTYAHLHVTSCGCRTPLIPHRDHQQYTNCSMGAMTGASPDEGKPYFHGQRKCPDERCGQNGVTAFLNSIVKPTCRFTQRRAEHDVFQESVCKIPSRVESMLARIGPRRRAGNDQRAGSNDLKNALEIRHIMQPHREGWRLFRSVCEYPTQHSKRDHQPDFLCGVKIPVDSRGALDLRKVQGKARL